MTISQTFALALQHHQAGRLADAEMLYRQILAAQPNHAGALHHLGIIAQQRGRNELAVEWISRAIALEPNISTAHSNLGEAYRSIGRLEEAVASFRTALELKADSPVAHYNLANVLREKGLIEEAEGNYRRAVELKPNYAEAWLNLGGTFAEQGKLEEAIAHYRRALELRPGYPEAFNNLGLALFKQGQFGEAVGAYNRALELQPQDPDVHFNLGNAFWELGRSEEAEGAFRKTLQLQPDHLATHNQLGRVLQHRGDLDGAIHSYRRVLELQPDSAEAHSNLGTVLREQGCLDEALDEYRRALALNPDSAKLHLNLGAALKDEGRLDEAIAEYRCALQLDPADREAHNSLIYALHLDPGGSGGGIVEEHRRWNRQFGEPILQSVRPHSNDRSPERRLRVGYVSADFRFHPVSFFVAPLLKAHNRERFEIHCYANVRHGDGITRLLQESADRWQDVHAFSDVELAERVREDGIDILVDLGLHTPRNRLAMFARKPAPVQISWLGYPGSSGLPAMDYRITDGLLEPDGSPWSSSVETLIRLPETWCCFEAITEYPEPGGLPALESGYVTFGSLNNFSKINEGVLRLWARVLQAVGGSRLLMQCPAGAAQARVWQWFETQGIAADRLDLVSRTASRAEFLRLFERIDIGLDPFPYSGGTTTFEALWMGIPVVSLAGNTAAGRMGLSALTNVGLAELAALSEDDYVQIATRLAGDRSRLTELRATLRGRMQVSPLMDAARFARNMEDAYRMMWKEWCAGKSG